MDDIIKFMSPGQAARMLGVTTATLRLWRKNGVGPPYRQFPRNHVRYNRDELMTWLEATEVMPEGVRHD
ncbi:MAG: helix-turn-helix domain-containing protein [Gemmataceae bacterium]